MSRKRKTGSQRCLAKGCRVAVAIGSWLCISHWKMALPTLQRDLESFDPQAADLDAAYLKAALAARYLGGDRDAVIDFLEEGPNEALRELEAVRVLNEKNSLLRATND